MHTRWREPSERYITELFGEDSYAGDLKHRAELIAEGHQRLVLPLYCLAFVLIGLATLLSGEFNRRGHPRRVLLAILIIAILEAQSLALHDLANRDSLAIPGMYAGVILPILASLYVLLRTPRRRARRALDAPAKPV